MPYMMVHSGEKYCVHKQNSDGSAGEKIKCHPTEQEAKDHMAALYAAMNGEKKALCRYRKAITDAPNLRADDAQSCAWCKYFQFLPPSDGGGMDMAYMASPSSKGICQKYEFETDGGWVCDSYEKPEPKAGEPIPVAIVADETRSVKAVTKSEKDGEHPASHYLVVEDPKEPSTWHLRVKDTDGQLDHGLMGAAWAALHEGYRGSKYDGPNKQDALSKLKKYYESEKIDLPSEGKSITADDTVIAFGDTAVKALGNHRYGGYLVRYSTADDPDLTGEYFTAKTDFGSHQTTPIYWDHGLDSTLKRRQIGEGEIKDDGAGKWLEYQLSERDEYEKAIIKLHDAGKVGLSSGTASHLVERVPTGKATFIAKWPLGLDASATVTPAEPRNGVIPLKSIKSIPLTISESEPANPQATVEAATAVKTAASGEAAQSPTGTTGTQPKEETTMDEKEMKSFTDSLTSLSESVKALSGEVSIIKKALEKEPPTNGGGHVTVTHDEADTPYKAICPRAPFGKFLQDVRSHALGGAMTPQLKAILGSNEGMPSEGGWLVGTEQENAIDKKMFDAGLVLSRCDSRAIGAGANSIDFFGRDEDSRANGSRYGGVTGYRVAEGGTITASGAVKFYKYTLKPKEYAAVYYATGDVLQDAGLLESEIMDAVPSELAFMIDDDIINGLGAAGCTGIIPATCTVSVTKETGQAATTFVYENVVKMWSRMWGRARQNAVWLINQDVEPQLYTMSLAVGTGGSAVFLPPGGASDTPYARLFGRPVIPTEYCATLGTAGDVILADFSQYKVATKGDLQTARSIHVQFLTNQECFRFIRRVDGQPKWKNPLTPFKGTSNTQSPFVTVAVRA